MIALKRSRRPETNRLPRLRLLLRPRRLRPGKRGPAARLGLWGADLGLLAIGIGRTIRVLRRLLGGILGRLGLLRRHDAEIMLRMLKIILGRHPVARTVGIPGQLQVFLVNMRGRAANLHFRAGRIKGAVGVEAAAAAIVAAAATATAATVIMLRPAAASTRAFHECTIMLCQKIAFVSLRSGVAKCCPAQSKVRLGPLPPHLRAASPCAFPASSLAEFDDFVAPNLVHPPAYSKGAMRLFQNLLQLAGLAEHDNTYEDLATKFFEHFALTLAA